MSDDAQQPDYEGGSGGENKDNARDARMMERAIRRRWNISPETKDKVLNRLEKLIGDDDASERAQIMACRGLMQAEAQNQADEHKDRPDRLEISMVDSEELNRYTERYGVDVPSLRDRVGVNGNGKAGTNGNGKH